MKNIDNKKVKVIVHTRLTDVDNYFNIESVIIMLYTHKELENLHKSDYQIKKAVAEGKFFKIERGLYSDKSSVEQFEIIGKKYPDAIFTMDSAFYFHGLTDVIPMHVFLSVKRDTAKIADRSIIQIFVLDKYHEIGKVQIPFEGTLINIYNKERMLIELIRNKKRLGFDYYKEIINSYRRIIHNLDIRCIEEYSGEFDIENYIFRIIQEEVF